MISGLYSYLSVVLSTFKVQFEVKCARSNNIPIALAMSRIVITIIFTFFWLLRRLPFLLQSQVGQILLNLWRTVCQSKISFHHLTVSYGTLLNPLTSQFSKHMYNRMTELCANFYIRSLLIHSPTNNFNNSDQRQVLLNWKMMSLKLCGAEVQVYTYWK